MVKIGRKKVPKSKLKTTAKNDKFGSKHQNKHHKNSTFIRRSKQMENIYKSQLLNSRPNVEGPNAGFENKHLEIIDEDGATNEPQFYDRLVSTISLNGRIENESLSKVKHETLLVTNNDTQCEIENETPQENQESDNHQSQFYVYKNVLDHFNYTLTSQNIEKIMSENPKEHCAKWTGTGHVRIRSPEFYKSDYTLKLGQASVLLDDMRLNVKSPLNKTVKNSLTPMQAELFHVLSGYQDLYYPQRSHLNCEELVRVYCLHSLNHILKTKALIIRNNDKIAAAAKTSNEKLLGGNYQDQGLTRLKVLILVPFRESALCIVNQFAQLLYGEDAEKCVNGGKITNYKRFVEEYKHNTLHFPKANKKPLDYEKLFSGNVDDNFKLGIRFSKKSVTLYSDLDSSDIVIASPLSLRRHIGTTDTKSKNYDFLNSIEILIIDQAEILMAQNWDSLLYILDHTHLQPQKLPQINYQRVRNLSLSGQSKFYRQTLLLSSHDLPEFRSVVNSKCFNYKGSVLIENPVELGDINNIVVNIKQTFKQIECSNLESVFEDRFQYFINEIMPQFKNASFAHCLIFVPSYFDFVRLRNYFKEQSINYVQISEYTKNDKVARARDLFYHSGVQIMLYSERAHFYRRRRIKGIRHIIFYQPPNWPNFYSEMINFMLDIYQNLKDGLANSMSITVLYTKYDILSLSNIVGSELAQKLIKSNKLLYVFSQA